MKSTLSFFTLLAALIFSVACSPSAAPAVPPSVPATQPQVTSTSMPSSTAAAAPTVAATAVPIPTSAAQSSVAPAPAQPAPAGNALDIILNAQKAFTTVQSVRMNLVNTLSDGTTHSTTIEYLAPDRVHATIEVGAQTSEFIVIRGQGTWMKENDQWSQSGFDVSSIVFAFLDPQIVTELAKGISVNGIKYDGPAVLDGIQTWVYEYNMALASPDQNNPLTANGTYKIWIGQNDGRPYRMEGNTDDAMNQGQKIQTVVTYDYNAQFQIDSPQ